VSIHRYANRLRLREGVERIVEGEEDLSHLALDLGFSSHSHFSDVFRREFSLTPREFRRAGSLHRSREMSKILKVASHGAP
jgi:AraC-like DNA-binding protein